MFSRALVTMTLNFGVINMSWSICVLSFMSLAPNVLKIDSQSNSRETYIRYTYTQKILFFKRGMNNNYKFFQITKNNF